MRVHDWNEGKTNGGSSPEGNLSRRVNQFRFSGEKNRAEYEIGR